MPKAERRRLLVNGLVQGVGFRPFVYKLARGESLTGRVTNTSEGVVIEVQGAPAVLDRFTTRLAAEAPPLARVVSVKSAVVVPVDEDTFVILASQDRPGTSTLIPPDVATCDDCLREINAAGDRRHRYAFTNCTNCGPRWTIIGRIPYDRPFTSMAPFHMCDRCRAEYDDPTDRRFHAQPNACPVCGPRLWLSDADGAELADQAGALAAAARVLADGRILAVKGLGGFHLAVRADDDTAVARLRERKHREAKPLAIMVPDLATVRTLCRVNDHEAALLRAPQAPIVLLEKTPAGPLAADVAAGHRRLGVMLPYTPLHHLLLTALAPLGVTALVMTSGNASDEPICLANDQARRRLRHIADRWLLHDRDILRRADDSVVQVLDGQLHFFRRSRGYAPLPIILPETAPETAPVLAVGPELKNTICLLKDGRAFLSPHIGDLANLEANDFFQATIDTLQEVLECAPTVLAHDLHPDYFSTRWARGQTGRTCVAVQHHHAHMAAVMAEHDLTEPAVGLIMDGTGYGPDGTIWGGEILVGDRTAFTRWGHFQPVPLPGGEAAIKAPWRTGLSYLQHAFGADRVPDLPFLAGKPVTPVLEIIARNLNSPLTSSCGRLFDAVAALTGGWDTVCHEAQAASEFMAMTDPKSVALATPWAVALTRDQPRLLPVAPIIRAAVADLRAGATVPEISARFHRTLIDLLTRAARAAAADTGRTDIILSGGSFQNEILMSGLMDTLTRAGLRPHRPLATPCNDGQIALGQAVIARARLQAE